MFGSSKYNNGALWRSSRELGRVPGFFRHFPQTSPFLSRKESSQFPLLLPWGSCPSISIHLTIHTNRTMLSLAEPLINPALIHPLNCALRFSLSLSFNCSTGQGVWRANTFIMFPANKIWITLQGTKLNLQFPLVHVINYWFKTRGVSSSKG